MFDCVIIHYNEIAIKGNNRILFERKLVDNIKLSLKGIGLAPIRKYGYIIIDLKGKDYQPVKEILQRIPGIAFFFLGKVAKLEIEDIKEKALALANDSFFSTFKINAKRSNKKFSFKSNEINATVGEYILETLNKKVDVHKPDLTIFIEVTDDKTYVHSEKILGIGGLPVNERNIVISSLSGGFDSPVASYLMMKRGCSVIFVHIYNNSLVKKAVLEKIQLLVNELTKFQLTSKLYVVPFAEVQKEIIANVPSTHRMIIYRRYMFKIINEIALREYAKAVITGDSVGQVASQTLENIQCIYQASNIPILTPLIGLNKDEIIDIAKKINTFEFSKIPYPDCCSFMNSDHPITKGIIEKIDVMEKEIKDKEEKLINDAINKADIFEYTF